MNDIDRRAEAAKADIDRSIEIVGELSALIDAQAKAAKFVRWLGVACGLVVVVLTGLTVLLVLRSLGVR